MTKGDERGRQDLTFSESQVREIIERALRAEPEATGISLAELQRIADELDIDRSALNQALEEMVAQPSAGKNTRTSLRQLVDGLSHLLDDVLPRRGRLLSGVVFGASVGWISGAFSPGSELDVPVGVAMVALTLANSISRRLGHRFREFVVESVGMWGAFAATWAVTYGEVTDDLLTWVALNTIASVVWGWWLIRRSPDDRELSASHGVPRLPAEPSRRDDDVLRREKARSPGALTLVLPGTFLKTSILKGRRAT